jgi:hypothetical protein
MSEIEVEWILDDGNTLRLVGCERASEGHDGALVLTFAEGAKDLAELEQRAALGALTGLMTISEPVGGTEYYCTFVRRSGQDALMQLVCPDD